METIRISISKSDMIKLGIKKTDLTFLELKIILENEIAKDNLSKCVALAEKYGLSSMSIDEINDEVKAVRDAKNHS
ncbi:hypothetical protein [Mongoliitalea daihaiensis]|uniref:hypothetical protein n=1 Tax=Mongoliitalea daihaiensis TaxID=2782006 RepID=UPI001F2F6BC8|nr:hypothetical protein [Mongoliitalea daihaiensis]UJP66827.1 hypothetical protein IPZ59_09660 [Mongoliitalea daihaiensis]